METSGNYWNLMLKAMQHVWIPKKQTNSAHRVKDSLRYLQAEIYAVFHFFNAFDWD